jgi:phage shock protein A
MYVSLDDDELVDLILERPHLVATAFAKLQAQYDDAAEDRSRMYKIYAEQRAKIKELETKLGLL